MNKKLWAGRAPIMKALLVTAPLAVVSFAPDAVAEPMPPDFSVSEAPCVSPAKTPGEQEGYSLDPEPAAPAAPGRINLLSPPLSHLFFSENLAPFPLPFLVAAQEESPPEDSCARFWHGVGIDRSRLPNFVRNCMTWRFDLPPVVLEVTYPHLTVRW